MSLCHCCTDLTLSTLLV